MALTDKKGVGCRVGTTTRPDSIYRTRHRPDLARNQTHLRARGDRPTWQITACITGHYSKQGPTLPNHMDYAVCVQIEWPSYEQTTSTCTRLHSPCGLHALCKPYIYVEPFRIKKLYNVYARLNLTLVCIGEV